MKRVLEFATVAEAVSVLGKYTTEARLRAVEALGYDLKDYKQRELAEFVCGTREKVGMALVRMGHFRRSIYRCTSCGGPVPKAEKVCLECRGDT